MFDEKNSLSYQSLQSVLSVLSSKSSLIVEEILKEASENLRNNFNFAISLTKFEKTLLKEENKEVITEICKDKTQLKEHEGFCLAYVLAILISSELEELGFLSELRIYYVEGELYVEFLYRSFKEQKESEEYKKPNVFQFGEAYGNTF